MKPRAFLGRVCIYKLRFHSFLRHLYIKILKEALDQIQKPIYSLLYLVMDGILKHLYLLVELILSMDLL